MSLDNKKSGLISGVITLVVLAGILGLAYWFLYKSQEKIYTPVPQNLTIPETPPETPEPMREPGKG